MKNIKWILSSILFFASLLTEFLLSNILASANKTVSIKAGTLIAISLLFLAICLWCLLTFIAKKNKTENQIKKLNEQSEEEHSYYENKIKELKENLEELNKNHIKNYDEPGNLLFLLALSQDTYEPLKIQLLKKAALEHKNVFAAVILAGIYKSGLFRNNIVIVDKNNDAALELYEAVNNVDPYGITDWLIGYTYEKNQASRTEHLSEQERLDIAMQYYIQSKNKNYPKAWNSIGKFYHYGWSVGRKNDVEAIGYYKAASNRLDVYATINCGHSEMKNYYLNNELPTLINAHDYFLTAAKYNTSEAWLWLGIVSEELIHFRPENASVLLMDAKDYYLKSFVNTENKYSATGWYMLGCLICNHPELAEDSSLQDIFATIVARNWAIECFSKAFTIFQNIYEKEEVPEDKYTCYYNYLRENFLNLKNQRHFNN